MTAALEESRALFVRRWGEMAGYWGISRTMAEIHALLYASARPLSADEIMTHLAISRGNASMNLRALVDWGLVERVHQRGERREYFRADPDVWAMFETIMRQRRRREVEPIVETLERCRELVRGAPSDEARVFRRRLEDMLTFLRATGAVVDLMLRLGPRGLQRLTGVLKRLVR
jgi:DNA-binding transcriptional regulator GbsR (MarR family)